MSNGIAITVSFNGLCFFSSKDFPCGLLRIWHDFPVGMTAYFYFFMGYVTDNFNDDDDDDDDDNDGDEWCLWYG